MCAKPAKSTTRPTLPPARRKLLDATLTLMLKRGYAATTVWMEFVPPPD